MGTQEKMFKAIDQWQQSGKSKSEFLIAKDFSEAKFNYWISKWKALQGTTSKDGFEEIGLSGIKPGKILEITTASGIKITVFT